MTRVVKLGAGADLFAAAEHGAHDRPGPHVMEVGNGVEEFSTAGFQGGNGIGQSGATQSSHSLQSSTSVSRAFSFLAVY